LVAKQRQKPKRSLILGWAICGLGALFYCYEYLLRIEPSIMIPELEHYFNVNAETIGLMTALYYYAYTPMQLVAGVTVDRFGPRRVLTFAVAMCAIGSIIFGSFHSIYIAGFGRFIIGFGSAFAFVGVLKLATIWLPANRFALFSGLAVALGMVGAMAGDLELTVLVHRMGWYKTLIFGAVFGAFLTPIVWLFIRDSVSPKKNTKAENATSYKAAIDGFVQVMKNSQIWLVGIIGGLLYLSLSVFAELWGITFLRHVYKFTSSQSAAGTSLVFMGWLIGAPLNGWISDKIHSRRIPLIIGSIIGGVFITLILSGRDFSVTTVEMMMFLFGLFSSVQIVCFAVGRENTEPRMVGAAVAFVNTLVMLGGLIFQPLVGALLDLGWTGGISGEVRMYTSINYQVAMGFMPIGYALSFILTFFLKESYGKEGKV